MAANQTINRMNPFKYIPGMLCLSFLLTACSGEEEGLSPAAEYAGVSFTASQRASGTDATGSVEGLVDKGKVAVYVWQGNRPSEENRPAYSNLYTFHVENNSCKLDSVSGSMKLPVGDGYYFYALSSNDPDLAAPVMATGNRTATLRNGVDYLMATSSSVNVSGTTAVSVPLSFRHIATQIVLTVQPADVNGYTSAGSLTAGIAPIDSTGSYIDLSKTWSTDSPNVICCGTDAAGGTPLERADGQVKAAAQIESGPNFTVSFIILPVAGNAKIPLQFDFTDIVFSTGGTQSGKTYTARLTAPADGLKGGYTYAYSVKISRQAAAFNSLPKVTPWVTDGINLDEVIEVDPK